MKRVPNTNSEFVCDANEVVTVTISPINTDFIVSCSPQTDDIILVGNVVTIKVKNSIKTVVLGFDFSGTSGGSYRLALSGTGGGSFNRGVLQPGDDLPVIRAYTFHV